MSSIKYDGIAEEDIKTEYEILDFNCDPLVQYLREIGSLDLLSRDEEIQYSSTIMASQEIMLTMIRQESKLAHLITDDVALGFGNIGDIVRSVLKTQTLNKKTLNALQDELKVYEKARNRMVEGNQRLVTSIAKKYVRHGVEMNDLIQEGNIGLMRAAERFNPEIGTKFSTYATYWIKQNILKTAQIKMVRLPTKAQSEISGMKEVIHALIGRYNRRPTPVEISDFMAVPISQVHKIIMFMQLEHDTHATEDSGFEEVQDYVDNIEDSRGSPEDAMVGKQCENVIDTLLKTFPREEQMVVRMRIWDNKSFMEIEKSLGIPAGDARKIYSRMMLNLSSQRNLHQQLF
ncbi:MAG: sigma-70 family RNA polymerase sigma factor [Pseudomonadota bacterium]|nr:sigma-70 family RNA polymerase sigma factor [Pseudomonadota bacterium]